MEIDRFLTRYCFYPFRKTIRGKRNTGIPILMYHSISDDDESNVHPYFRLCVSPEIFAAQMQYLKTHNYSSLSLDDALRSLSSHELQGPGTMDLSENHVVITFDDGYMDFYSHAFPVLEACGFSATVFVPTAFVEKNTDGLKGRRHLSWEQIVEMHRRGIIFGSHTVTHREMDTLSDEEVEYELKYSKSVIEDHTGAAVDSFSYPFAFPENNKTFTQHLRDMLEKCGYKNGVCTRIGTVKKGEDRYFLSRIPVNSRDDRSLFQSKLEGGYDWLQTLQYLFKVSKRVIHGEQKTIREVN